MRTIIIHIVQLQKLTISSISFNIYFMHRPKLYLTCQSRPGLRVLEQDLTTLMSKECLPTRSTYMAFGINLIGLDFLLFDFRSIDR